MVGDAVNTASRIQDLNKQFGTDILLSHSTKELLGASQLQFTSLGESTVKGKTRPITIYTMAS
jgi:adenylate cyclase